MSDCFGFMGRKKKAARETKVTVNLSKQQKHSETAGSVAQVQEDSEIDKGADEVEVKSKPSFTERDLTTETMQQAAAYPLCPNSGRDNVLTILERIYNRFRPIHGKLLPEEYEALGVILGGVDHAVLALKETRRWQAPIAIPPYRALNVITEDGDKDVFLNTAARSSTSSELTMQMFYQPPFNEGGPASNYSMVWIFKPKFETKFLPFVTDSLGGGANEGRAELESSISTTRYAAIEEGKPYAVSNFIAQQAFLQVYPQAVSSGKGVDTLDIQFKDNGTECADIYFKPDKNSKPSDLKWAMWSVHKDNAYYLLPLKLGIRGDDRKIYASMMSKKGKDEQEDTEPPENVFVWRFNHNFKVNCDHPISSLFPHPLPPLH